MGSVGERMPEPEVEAFLTATSLQTRPSPSVPSSNYKPKNNIIHNTTIKSEIQMI